MRRFILLLLVVMMPILIGANAILNKQGQRPLYANHILKIQLSSEAISRTSLPEGLFAEAPAFGIEELDILSAKYGKHRILRAHIRMKDRAFEEKTGFDRWFLVKFDSPLDISEALRAFKAYPDLVQEAIPEYYAYTMIVPNDTFYANNWGHNNTAQLPVYSGGSHSGAGVGTIGFDSDAQLAWDQTQAFGSASVIIAIIDSGVDTAHADLRLVAGYDYGDNDSNPMDNSSDPGHGTSCSGVAAAKANNGLGITGVAGGCSVMPLKVADSNADMSFTSIENAITHAGNNNVDVISMSLGAEGGTAEGSSPSTDATLEYAYAQGVTIFAATANSNTSTIAYPANHNKVISVGAASPTGQRKSNTSSDGEYWWGSNYGVNIQDNRNSVDIMAPTILPSTDISGNTGYSTTDYYMWFNGTSCATPYAAGVAALLISKAPSLTPAQVRTAITTTATDMTIDGGVGWDRFTGYGMINANAALNSLVPGMPTCTITAPVNGAVLNLNSSITINVNASDSDGSIANVKFYVDNNLQFTDSTSPYSWIWNSSGASAGSHSIKAIATDNASNTATHEISISLLAPPDEGFESGNFAAYGWVNSSSSPWIVQSSEKYSGTYAAKSGVIGHNAQTNLSITMNVSTQSEISFFQMISSESGYDYLRFYIDGILQNEWSGSGNWSQQSYPVNAGTRTFLWSYQKDNSVVGGSDCAWLDHIIFPNMGTYFAAPQNFTAIPGNQSVQLSWSAPASGSPTGYKIYRNASLLTTTTNLSYQDTAVTNGTSYTYYLLAVYAGGESDPTPSLTVTPDIIVSGIIGSGTGSNSTSEACPINVYYESLHGQSVYLASELNAAGLNGATTITQLGFNITGLPTLAMPNYVVRMGHTTATNAASWIPSTALTTVWSSASYQPVVTGWNMYTLSTPFEWNGTDNIVIDTAYGDIGSWTQSGTTQNTTLSSGYRYVRSDDNDQTNVFTGGSISNYRPNIQLSFQIVSYDPLIDVEPESISYGDVQVGSSSIQQFTITNTGNDELTGSISTPTGYNVTLNSRARSIATEATTLERNILPFSIAVGESELFDLSFAPTNSMAYNGNVVISSNAANNPTLSIAVSGTGFIPPSISLNTNELYISLIPGEEGSDSFIISNNGGQTLNYSINVEEPRNRISGAAIPTSDMQGRNISGSTLVLDTELYNPGSTLDWTFTVTNNSQDEEWLKDVIITFPAGITVNSVSNFIGGNGGDLIPDITSGAGVTIDWHGENSSGWGLIYGNGDSATATVNVTIGAGISGALALPWQLNGDLYGSDPHTLSGSIAIDQDIPPIDWFFVDSPNGSIPAGQSTTITGYFSAVDKDPGDYYALLTVSSNDPLQASIQVNAQMQVLNPNTPPVIDVPDTFSFPKNTVLEIDLSPYVSDVDEDELSISCMDSENIVATVNGLVVTLSATAAWTGTEEITFTVSDGTEQSFDIASITVYNRAPSIELPASFSFDLNASWEEDFSGYISDPDGDALTIQAEGNTNIQIAVDGSIVSFSAVSDWHGTESITFTVNDGTDSSSDDVPVTVILNYLESPIITSIEKSALTVTIQWNAVPNANSYRIYRATEPDGTWEFLANSSSTIYEDSSLISKAFYKVLAVYEAPSK